MALLLANKLTLILVVLLALSGLTSASDELTLPIEKGMHILRARKKLIAQGWQPNSFGDSTIGIEKTLKKMGVSEIQVCTMGEQFCTFNYRKRGQCLGVTTTGEAIKDMVVDAWDFTCPSS